MSMLAGGLLLLSGFVLYAGEKAGRLLIFPFVGEVTLLVGIGALAIGAALAGRRAAMVFSVLILIGGFALYAVGLALVAQLGTRLYQAAGLLTVLVGIVAVYACCGMDRTTKPSQPCDTSERESADAQHL